MAMDFRNLAKKQTTLSTIMADREKMSNDKLIATYPDGVTITGFDYVTSKKTGKQYPVFTIAEDAGVFVNGGTVIDRVFQEFVKVCDGDVDAASQELKRQGGLKVKFGHGTTKAGDELITVEII